MSTKKISIGKINGSYPIPTGNSRNRKKTDRISCRDKKNKSRLDGIGSLSRSIGLVIENSIGKGKLPGIYPREKKTYLENSADYPGHGVPS
jgi:hypothetical protein